MRLMTVLSLIFFLISTSGLAATNVQNYERSNSMLYDSTESLSLEESLAPDYKIWLLTLGYSYKSAPLSVKTENNQNNLGPVIDWYQTLNFGGAYRVNETWSIGILGAAVQAKMSGLNESSLSDTQARVTYRKSITSTSAWGISGYLTLPTGYSVNYTTDSGVGTGVDFMFEKNLKFIQYVGSIGFLGNSQAKDATDAEFDQTKRVKLKFGSLIPLVLNWSVNLEAKKDFTLPQNNNINPNELRAGLRWAYKPNFAFFGGFGLDSVSNTEQTDTRLFVGIKFFDLEEKRSSKTKTESCYSSEEEVGYDTIVHFPNKEAVITPESRNDLENLVSYVHKNLHKVINVSVIGHTSLPGGAMYNKVLSRKRAANIGALLLNLGLPENLIRIVGMGKEQLLSKGMNESDHSINRRVEVEVNIKKSTLQCKESL